MAVSRYVVPPERERSAEALCSLSFDGSLDQITVVYPGSNDGARLGTASRGRISWRRLGIMTCTPLPDEVWTVARLLARGLPNNAVASRQGIAVRTVRRRVAVVMGLRESNTRFEAGYRLRNLASGANKDLLARTLLLKARAEGWPLHDTEQEEASWWGTLNGSMEFKDAS